MRWNLKSVLAGIALVGAGWALASAAPRTREDPVDAQIRRFLTGVVEDVDAGSLGLVWQRLGAETKTKYEKGQAAVAESCRWYSARLREPGCGDFMRDSAAAMERAHGGTLEQIASWSARETWIATTDGVLGAKATRPRFSGGEFEQVYRRGDRAQVKYRLPSGELQVFFLILEPQDGWRLEAFDPYWPQRDWRRGDVPQFVLR